MAGVGLGDGGGALGQLGARQDLRADRLQCYRVETELLGEVEVERDQSGLGCGVRLGGGVQALELAGVGVVESETCIRCCNR